MTMKQSRSRALALVGALVLAQFAAGCASPPPERFYRLAVAPSAAAQPVASASDGPVVTVGAVTLPALVDRPQIVTLAAGSRVEVSEAHRWAEPLRFALGRVVAEQLAAALGTPLVYAYPQVAVADPAFRVTLNVQRLDATRGVAVDDELLWTVRRVADGQLRSGRSHGRAVPADASYDALAAAHVEALAAVSGDIARAIGELATR
ncbi:PqiC family protein [Methylibium petroleiphilum]|uniref:PqiC family protein n=1 Tax=Methylibium petroleiphilum TaxID=105560 RepID=UPI003D2B11BD